MVFLARLLITVCIAVPVFGATWYVTPTTDGAQNGTSWADAYTNLQFGLGSAAEGDTVFVGSGTYEYGGRYIVTNKAVSIIGVGRPRLITTNSFAFLFTGSTNCVFENFYMSAGCLNGYDLTINNVIIDTPYIGFYSGSPYRNRVYIYNSITIGGEYGAYLQANNNLADGHFHSTIAEAGSSYSRYIIQKATGWFENCISGNQFIVDGTQIMPGTNWIASTRLTIPGAGYVRPTFSNGYAAVLGDYRLAVSATNTRGKGIFSADMTNTASYVAYDMDGLPRCWPIGSTNVDIGPYSMRAQDSKIIFRRRFQ